MVLFRCKIYRKRQIFKSPIFNNEHFEVIQVRIGHEITNIEAEQMDKKHPIQHLQEQILKIQQ